MARIFDTTFDYPEWTQSDGLSDATCTGATDGISGWGGWTASPGSEEDQITTAANHAAGGGGRGFRHKCGNGDNNTGGSLRFSFSARSEIWIRWYCRLPSTLGWDPLSSENIKMVYANYGDNGHSYWGWHEGVIGGHVNIEAGNRHSTKTWADVMGVDTGDDLWHCYELHLKMNPVGAVADGVVEMWIDNELVLQETDVQFSSANGSQWSAFLFGENHAVTATAGAAVVGLDYDDVAVDDSARIGPLSAGLAVGDVIFSM